jgi:hypothetical protein
VEKNETTYNTGVYIMKITKVKLKEIIQEELTKLKELETLGASDARKQARLQSKEVVASDVTSIERSAIVQLQKSLIAAARVKNIATGTVAALIKRLLGELEKMAPAATPTDAEG